MTYEQQMWDKWADDDEERAWLIPKYRIGGTKNDESKAEKMGSSKLDSKEATTTIT